MDGTIRVVFAIAVVMVVCLAGLIVFQLSAQKKHSASLSYRRKAKTAPKGQYLYLYDFISRFPILRGSIASLNRKLSALSIYTYVEARVLTVKEFMIGLGLFLGIAIFSLIMFNNLVHCALVMLIALVFRDQFLHKRIDKTYEGLLKDELIFLSSLRQEFVRTRSVTEAFSSVECGKYIARAVKDIRDALMSSNVEERLAAFSAATPLPTLQTLSSVAYIVDNRGDSMLLNGSSMFSTAIDMIAEEVRIQIRRAVTTRQLFGLLEFIPLIPVFGMSPIRSAFSSMVPGTASIYNGSMGFMFTVVVLLASLFGYYMVVSVTRMAAVISDDRTAIDKSLMSHKQVREYVSRIRPRKPRVLAKKVALLRRALSRNTIDYICLRKVYMAVLAFVAVIILAVCSVFTGRAAILQNIAGSEIMGAAELTPREEEMIRTMDTEFLKKYTETPSDEEIAAFVRATMPAVKDYNLESHVNRMRNKLTSYRNAVFQWWMPILALLFAAIAYRVPEWILRRRAKLVAGESVEDCLQMQTVIAIMMNTSTDTLDLLEYLYKNSRVFRSVLVDCYLNYTADADRALRVAKSKSALEEFRGMMDKLSLTVSQITIAEAFSDLISERDHMLRMRESAQLHALNVRRRMVSPFALAPMITLIMCFFLAPIVLLAYSMFVDLMASGVFQF
jgi:hypothetical protein